MTMNHPTNNIRAISIGKSANNSIVIRNRSQTEIVSVERKRVSYRSSEKPTHVFNSQKPPISAAPTLLPSYRNRASSNANSKPTVIYIKSQ
ncbi:unnamed protein product [Caenorhabditis angaria]|uniref:Uncharacterized protein n=1 Tax=Caenorhabditis angaria TaxID=860376 RepID=A0A9P1N2H2_9PELO|nr:unnamed protein product [Caenorhabditis angaria]